MFFHFISQNVSDRVLDRGADSFPLGVADIIGVLIGFPTWVPDSVFDRVTFVTGLLDRVPVSVPDRILNRIADRVVDKVPDRVADRVREFLRGGPQMSFSICSEKRPWFLTGSRNWVPKRIWSPRSCLIGFPKKFT